MVAKKKSGKVSPFKAGKGSAKKSAGVKNASKKKLTQAIASGRKKKKKKGARK